MTSVTSKTQEIIERARKRISSWYSYWNENAEDYREKVEIVIESKQWSVQTLRDRKNSSKPSKTFNRLYCYVKQMVGENRKNTPSIRLHANSAEGQQRAKIFEGLIREIAYKSNAEIAIQIAFENGLLGFGALAVEHVNDEGKSKLLVRAFPDPTYTAFDTGAKNSTKSNGRYCAYCYVADRKELQERYKKDRIESLITPNDSQDFEAPTEEDIVYVWEYFEREKNIIRHYRIVNDSILAQTIWPGKMMPVILLCGDSHYIRGKERTRSFVEDAIEPQKWLNYIMSEITQQIMSSTGGIFLASTASVEGIREWTQTNPNTRVLLYNHGTDMPAKVDGNSVSSNMIDLYRVAGGEIQQSLGLFEANLGRKSNEISGIAIQNRIKQGQSNVFVYFDNLNRGVEQLGRVIADAIPQVYLNPQNLFISNKNGERERIRINIPTPLGIENDIESFKEYDVEISVGASFENQRQETYARLLQFANANPAYANAVAPVALEYVGINETSEIQKNFEQQQQMASQQAQQQQQMQQSMMQMQIQMEQQRLKIEGMRVQADSFNKRMTAGAKMMDSQVNAEKAESAGLVEAAKLHTEMKKAELEFQGKQLQVAKEVLSLQ